MNLLSSVIYLIFFLFCCVNSILSQRLIFSKDTVVQESCESFPPPFESIDVINNTDEDLLLEWNTTDYDYPYDGSYFLIIDPIQYIPNTPQGQVLLSARDTTQIIFHIFTDAMLPGDSAFVQITVHDDDDTIHPTHVLTAIKYCPLQTGNVGPLSDIQFRVSPNPIYHSGTIYIPEPSPTALLVLYTFTGNPIWQIPASDYDIHFTTDDLPGGMYYLALVRGGRTTWMTRVVIVM